MSLPTIKPVTEVGSNRAPCEEVIRVAARMDTNAAQYGAFERRRRGLPVDQCGKRSDFLVDGKPICRAHAGQIALKALLAEQAADHDHPNCPCEYCRRYHSDPNA